MYMFVGIAAARTAAACNLFEVPSAAEMQLLALQHCPIGSPLSEPGLDRSISTLVAVKPLGKNYHFCFSFL